MPICIDTLCISALNWDTGIIQYRKKRETGEWGKDAVIHPMSSNREITPSPVTELLVSMQATQDVTRAT